MIISSRTPEGSPNICHVCRNEVIIEPSITSKDAPCPHCGQLLWFTQPELKPMQIKKKSRSILSKIKKAVTKKFFH